MTSKNTGLSQEDQELLARLNGKIRDSGKETVPSIPFGRTKAEEEKLLPVFVGTKGQAATTINLLYGEINQCIEKLQGNVADAVSN